MSKTSAAPKPSRPMTRREERMAPFLRMAKPGDARLIANLMDLSSAGGLAEAWGRLAQNGEDWRDIAIAEIMAPGSDLQLSNYVIAEIGGRLAGMVLLNGLSEEYNAADIDMVPAEVRPLFSLLVNAPGHLLIREIAVFPRYRGKGVGEALMIAAHSIAEGQGYPGIALNVHETNFPAQRLYVRNDFEPVATCRVHSHPSYAAGSRWYTMIRTL